MRGKDDIVYPVDYDRLLSAFAHHIVLVLNPRAVDYPIDNCRIASTKMAAALLGTTLESMQLWDILRSIARFRYTAARTWEHWRFTRRRWTKGLAA